MNLFDFDQFVTESFGAITIVRKPVGQLNEPDVANPVPSLINTGRASSVPKHWNNSPFMSGGYYGANPDEKKKKKRSILKYKDFNKKKKTKKNGIR